MKKNFSAEFKHESAQLVVDQNYTMADAAHAITDYIVGYYSALRPYEYNGGLPPNESENRYWKNSNAVASLS